MEFDHSVGISLSRIRCTTLSAGALLYAWSWAGLRAPRQFPLSACFDPPARKVTRRQDSAMAAFAH